MPNRYVIALLATLTPLTACGGGNAASGGGGAPASNPTGASATPSVPPAQGGGTSSGARCSGAKSSVAAGGSAPVTPPLTVPAGFTIQTIASVPGARELVPLPNGDLIVGTGGPNVYIVPNAESAGAAGRPRIFATIDDTTPPGEPATANNAEGVAFSAPSCSIFVAAEYHIWSTAYKDGDLSAEGLKQIATVRTGPTANPGDGDMHTSTSLAVAGSTLYASMGSSCNGCTGESDPMRAAIWRMNLDGSGMALLARRMRNAIAMAIDPVTGHLWAGGAGQDDLPAFHPYEYMDDVTRAAAATRGVADYGWPYCEENDVLYNSSNPSVTNCHGIAIPAVEFPAYITHIGAVFYPARQAGAHAFTTAFRSALFVSSHGSWHTPANNCTLAPEVDYVPMNGDAPATPMNWSSPNPSSQWHPFVTGFQPSCSSRIGRSTGLAVGSQGSLFVADDQAGSIYRIRQ